MAERMNKRVLWVSSAIGIVLVARIVQHLLRQDSAQNNDGIEEWDLIVVGSGSAGLAAAVHAAEEAPSARILVLEKAATIGGNSAKASSGMNAIDDRTDEKAVRVFVDDVKRSGGGLSDEGLVDVLVKESGRAIEFLKKIGVSFSPHLVQLGGHSEARTHTVTSGAVGWTIVSQLKAAVEALENVHVRTQSSVEKLIVDEDEENKNGSSQSVRGCVYRAQDGTRVVAHATYGVILATGGFGHNFQWLSKYVTMSPITTTNGNFSTGDGIELGEQVGAKVNYVDQVQIHPTSFIDPLAPEAETKILAPEKLRGLGGILVSQQGTRFVNELDTRDKVSQAILSLPEKSAYLILDDHIEDKVGSAMKFYKGKKLIQECPGGVSELEKRLGMPPHTLVKTVTELNTIASSEDMIPSCIWRPKIHKFDIHGNFLFAKITPSVHYTMGGLAIDTSAHVLDSSNTPIKHLYAAGEVTGGTHGRNRLGGNSLLECVVFGSIAGRTAVSSTLP